MCVCVSVHGAVPGAVQGGPNREGGGSRGDPILRMQSVHGATARSFQSEMYLSLPLPSSAAGGLRFGREECEGLDQLYLYIYTCVCVRGA